MSRVGVAFTANRSRVLRASLEWGSGLALVLLAGCWTQERFRSTGIEELCERASDCSEAFPPGSCAEALTASSAGCAYDPAMASDCAEQLDHARCGEVQPFGQSALEIPGSCALAFDCGDEAWLDPLGFE